MANGDDSKTQALPAVRSDGMLEVLQRNPGLLQDIARERFALEARMSMARMEPRKPEQVKAALLDMIGSSKDFAEEVLYFFRKGTRTHPVSKKKIPNYIEGPSVCLARPLAAMWGWIDFGWRPMARDENGANVEGYAFDMQTGSCRREGAYVPFTERRYGRGGTMYDKELGAQDQQFAIARAGAIAERNAVLNIIPRHIRDACCLKAKEVQLAQYGGPGKIVSAAHREQIVVAFERFGVSVELLEARLWHPIAELTSDEILELRAAHVAIREGQSRIQDEFPVGDDEPQGERQPARTGDFKPKDKPAAPPPTQPRESPTRETNEPGGETKAAPAETPPPASEPKAAPAEPEPKPATRRGRQPVKPKAEEPPAKPAEERPPAPPTMPPPSDPLQLRRDHVVRATIREAMWTRSELDQACQKVAGAPLADLDAGGMSKVEKALLEGMLKP